MAVNWMAAQELIERYNSDPRSFTDREAEMIATIANQFGMEFKRESRPLAKGAFDLADISTFGLLPNKWRPTSRGETVYGQTAVDKIAGGLGTIGGLFGAVGVARGAIKGGGAALGALRGSKAGEVVRKSAEGIQRSARGLTESVRGAGARIGGIGGNLGRAGQGYARGAMNYGQLGIERAATQLARRLGISISEAKKILAGTGIAGGTLLGLSALTGDSDVSIGGSVGYPPSIGSSIMDYNSMNPGNLARY
jgi:hypothetical protein